MKQIVIPDSARVVEVASFPISTYSHHDTLVETVVLDVNGHGVQIIRYDQDNADVIVSVDGHLAQVDMNNVNEHINSHTK